MLLHVCVCFDFLFFFTLWKFPEWACSQVIMSKKMGMVALLSSSSGIKVISRMGPTMPGMKQILWLPIRQGCIIQRECKNRIWPLFPMWTVEKQFCQLLPLQIRLWALQPLYISVYFHYYYSITMQNIADIQYMHTNIPLLFQKRQY